jgi:hypothetical protein
MAIKRLPHPRHYATKILRNALAGLIILFLSIFIGTAGYHYYFQISWIDSFYNASMILTGMGPVNAPPNDDAKIFASFYAIYSGVTFLTSVAVILSPVVHRFLHRFKIEVEE